MEQERQGDEPQSGSEPAADSDAALLEDAEEVSSALAAAQETDPGRFLDELERGAQEGAASAATGGAFAVRWAKDADLVESAREVLLAYRAQGGTEVMTSGYLDLQGNVWSAMVASEGGWVDLIVVAAGEGDTSEVRIARISADGMM